jgi:transcriptional antiterminator NusG
VVEEHIEELPVEDGTEPEELEKMSSGEKESPGEVAEEARLSVEAEADTSEPVDQEESVEENEQAEEDTAGEPTASEEDDEPRAEEEDQASVVQEPVGEVIEEVDQTEGDEEPEVEDLIEDEIEDEPAADEMPEPEALEAEADEDVETSEETAQVPDDDRHWYVVHCYSGYENKVRHNLEQRIETMGMKNKIFDVVVPTEEEIEVKDGKRRTVERRVFPGYILVQMLMDEDSWYVVRNTPGVTGFVGMGNEPTPLRQEEVAQIVKRMEAEAPRIKVTYKAGQKVRIIDGPFNDFIGTVSDIDMERAKVRVMVSFFGRETPVELDFLQVEKA